jgi:hypothetical protein
MRRDGWWRPRGGLLKEYVVGMGMLRSIEEER